MVHGDLVRPPQQKSSLPAGVAPDQKAANQEQTSIHLGRYVFVSPGCTLHPPSRMSNSASSTGAPVLTYYPLRVSDYVYIGPNTQVRAAEIRSHVYIGSNCVIGNMCIIKDNVKILDGSVLPANSVWTSNSIVAGRPARVIGELGEGWGSGGNSTAAGVDESVGIRSRERWAAVGNKR